MAKIKNIKGRQVFDSRGNPTLEAEVFSENGSAFSIVPSGASTGTHEAFELRDKDNKDYLCKSVFTAISNINDLISKALKNVEITDQLKIDKILDKDDAEYASLATFLGLSPLSASIWKGYVDSYIQDIT